MFCVDLRNNVMAFRICLVQENEKKNVPCVYLKWWLYVVKVTDKLVSTGQDVLNIKHDF